MPTAGKDMPPRGREAVLFSVASIDGTQRGCFTGHAHEMAPAGLGVTSAACSVLRPCCQATKPAFIAITALPCYCGCVKRCWTRHLSLNFPLLQHQACIKVGALLAYAMHATCCWPESQWRWRNHVFTQVIEPASKS